MARSLIASDDFNRASLGANWQQLNSAGAGNAVIIASTLLDGTASPPTEDGSAIGWIGAGTFSNDQYSSIIATDLSFGSVGTGMGVIVRASTDADATRDYYYFSVRTNGVGFFGKIVNGTETVFNTGAVTFTGGDRIELEAEGTTIRCCKNGTPLGGAWTATDSSLSTGKPGASPYNGAAGCNGDNWEGGDMAAAAGMVDDSATDYVPLDQASEPRTVGVW